MKRIMAFIAAVLVAYVLGTLAYSQLNLANLVELGMPVNANIRMATAWHDMTSMYDLYLPLVSIALLLGFAIVGLVLRWLPQMKTLGYITGGFIAIYAMDFLLGAVLTGGTHPLVVTRTTVGLVTLCLSGAVAGLVFALMVNKTSDATTDWS